MGSICTQVKLEHALFPSLDTIQARQPLQCVLVVDLAADNVCVIAGTIPAGQSVEVKLLYDIEENPFQAVLQASVLIKTSGRPAAKVGAALLRAASPHAITPPRARQGGGGAVAWALNTEAGICLPSSQLHAATVTGRYTLASC